MNDLASLESIVAQTLSGLVPVELPEEVAKTQAMVGEQLVTMSSRAWSGGPFRVVRTTHMQSVRRIKVFNLVAYPRSEFATPIFATDIVILGGQLRIGVVDAMPIFAGEAGYRERWIAPFKGLAERSVEIAKRFELKMEWSREYLGPNACLATGLSEEQLEPLYVLWREYWQLYLSLAMAEAPADAVTQRAVGDWQREYNREHAEVEMKRNPLVRYFGEEYGRRFIEGFLFSDKLELKEWGGCLGARTQ